MRSEEPPVDVGPLLPLLLPFDGDEEPPKDVGPPVDVRPLLLPFDASKRCRATAAAF